MTDATIITCTIARPESLAMTLGSIAEAIRNASDMALEVVVVDNGSTDNTQDTIQQWIKSVSFPVIALIEPRPGVSYARNAGIRAASGKVLVLIDDDCRLNADYLTVLKRYYAKDSGPIIRGGRVELGDPADLPFTIKLNDQPARMTDLNHPGNFLLGCNMTMNREVVDKIGFFDVRFGPGTPIHGGEETDYIYRAHHAGIPVEYVPDMTVKHFHGRRDKSTIKRLVYAYHVAGGALYAKHITDWVLVRHLYWNFRKCIYEIFEKNTYNDEFALSHKSHILGNLEGMARFWIKALRIYFRKTT